MSLRYHLLLPNVHEDLANESSLVAEGAVTRPTGRRKYVRVGSTAAVLAADACRSSNRTLFGTDIVLHIEKLDKDLEIAIRGSLPQSIRPLVVATPSSPLS